MMKTPRPTPRSRQSGIAGVLGVIFLIAAVIFVLSQTLSITGSHSIDNSQHMDSTAALFLAESGLETASASFSSVADADASTCTALGSGSPSSCIGTVSLGRGTYCFGPATPLPSGCTTACTSCTLQATGQVGSAARTLSRTFKLATIYGKSGTGGLTDASCAGDPIDLTVKNPFNVKGVAILNMGYRQHIPGGGQIAVNCSNSPLWNYYTQNGNPGVQVFGDSYTDIAANQAKTSLPLGLNRITNYAAVGAVFPGFSASAAPTLIGNYSSQGDTNNSGSSSGTVISGVAAASGANSWCYGADTLVAGFGARSGSTADAISAVNFNSDTTPSQSPAQVIALPPTITPRGGLVVHYPDSSATGAPGDVFSDIWFTHNPDFGFATAASSYKGTGTGAIGATFTGSISGTVLTVTVAPIGYPNTVIFPAFAGPPAYSGDTLTSSGGGTNVTSNPAITSQLTSTEAAGALGGRGTYQINGANQNVTSRAMTASSKILNVTTCTICYFAPGDPIAGAAYSISSQPFGTAGGVGKYILSGTAANGTTSVSAAVLAGTPGATIYVPTAVSMPQVSTPRTIVSVYSAAATGKFSQQTTVTAVNSPPNAATQSFQVSAVPTTPLKNATLCGGICAFFDNPSSTSETTTFSVTTSPGVGQWAAGFACLKGVDPSKIFPLTNTNTSLGTWHEAVN